MLRLILRKESLCKETEMGSLAKEICFIGGDQVDHVEEFLLFSLIAEKEIEKFFIRLKAQGFYFLVQPAFQHRLFCQRKLDAIFTRDESTESFKTLVVHIEKTAYVERFHKWFIRGSGVEKKESAPVSN